MGEGIFQLLFIGILILASVFDATSRRRKRKRRMEEMERQERVETPPASAETAPGTPAGRAESEVGGARQTADTMVPDDLWGILTGQQPVPRQAPEREETPARAEAPSPEDRAERRPPLVSPAPPERTPGVRRPPRRTPARTGAPGMEGAPERRPTEAPPWSPPTASPAPSRMPSARVAPTLAAAPPAPPPPASFQWNRAKASKPGQAAAYAELLRTGGPESLRRAVVLKEILGAPAAYRRVGWSWEDE